MLPCLRRAGHMTPAAATLLVTLLGGCSGSVEPFPTGVGRAATSGPGQPSVAGSPSAAPRQAPVFSDLPEASTTPSARYAASLAFDGTNHRMLLFGGLRAPGQPLGDTLEWNGTRWGSLSVGDAPSARGAAAAAWDPRDHEVVLFGGTGVGAAGLTDTWSWRGSQWVEEHPVHRPTLSTAPQLAWDDATQQMVLVGVQDQATLGWQTWTWTGKDWQAPPGTSPPAAAAQIAYDPDGRRLVFTSRDTAASPGAVQPLFGWSGSAWTPVAGGAPGGEMALVAQYSEHSMIAVTSTHGTFAWNGEGFEMRHDDGDAAVHDQAALAYYPTISLVVAVGGLDSAGRPSADVLAWNGRTWD